MLGLGLMIGPEYPSVQINSSSPWSEKGSLSATYSFSRSKDLFKKALKDLIKDLDLENNHWYHSTPYEFLKNFFRLIFPVFRFKYQRKSWYELTINNHRPSFVALSSTWKALSLVTRYPRSSAIYSYILRMPLASIQP